MLLSSKLDVNVKQVVNCCQEARVSILKNLTAGGEKSEENLAANTVIFKSTQELLPTLVNQKNMYLYEICHLYQV